MSTVTGLTAERMLEIEAASVVDGEVVGDNLILTKHDGSTIDAGNVRGPVGSGAVSLPQVRAKRTSNTAGLATNSPIGWNGEDWDTDGIHDSVTNSERLTIVTPGFYDVNGNIIIAASGAGTYRGVQLYHYSAAGVLLDSAGVQQPVGGMGGVRARLNPTGKFRVVSAGEYIVAAIQHDAGTPLTVDYVGSSDYSYLSASLISGL